MSQEGVDVLLENVGSSEFSPHVPAPSSSRHIVLHSQMNMPSHPYRATSVMIEPIRQVTREETEGAVSLQIPGRREQYRYISYASKGWHSPGWESLRVELVEDALVDCIDVRREGDIWGAVGALSTARLGDTGLQTGSSAMRAQCWGASGATA